MNRIKVKIKQFEVAEWTPEIGPAAVFYINGIEIADYLGRLDARVIRRGRSEYGNGWIGVSPELVLPPSEDYVGNPRNEFIADCGGRVPIAACGDCGIYWCDGIWAKIELDKLTVRWTSFVLNPHLDPLALDGVPDLVFVRAQYEHAFRAIENI
jgi:hypothetical protein